VLKVNVLSYNINTCRIFFTKDFWDHFSSQLVKDFRLETGLVLENKQRFFCDIKRSIFEYYYHSILKRNPKDKSLYQTFTHIFQKYSKNGLPHLVKNLSEVPVYYDDDHIVTDPVEIDFSTTSHKRESDILSIVSISDQLMEMESSSAFKENREMDYCNTFDDFLKQFMCHDEMVNILKSDYEKGNINHLIDSGFSHLEMGEYFHIAFRIYRHYDFKIGLPTIINHMNPANIDLTINADITKRFDLWHKSYTYINIYRSLTNYIGLDICEILYNEFNRKQTLSFKDGYQYVFCAFLLNNLYNRLIVREKQIPCNAFIQVKERVRINQSDPSNMNIFNNKIRQDNLNFHKFDSSLFEKSSNTKNIIQEDEIFDVTDKKTSNIIDSVSSDEDNPKVKVVQRSIFPFRNK